jgi:ABC-type cobalamin transport system ATPase subunit
MKVVVLGRAPEANVVGKIDEPVNDLDIKQTVLLPVLFGEPDIIKKRQLLLWSDFRW